MSDNDAAADLWRRVSPGVDEFTAIVIDGNPPSKPRPRVDLKRGRVYHSDEQEAAEKATAQVLRIAVKDPISGNVALGAAFYRKDRTNVDGDNLLKHLMDSANGILWHDDVQVTAMLAVVGLDAERPRTVVAVGQHRSSLDRTTVRAARSKSRKRAVKAGATFNRCTSCGQPISRGMGALCRRCRTS